MFLIGKYGVNGPDIDQLRKETITNINGVGDSHFKDPEFVKAAKDMHEARLLAEGGFKGSQWSSMEQRYERAEKELFARMEGLGREIENRVTGNDSNRLNDQGLKAQTSSAVGYGSASHHEKFAESLENSGANETQISGRLAAARSEGTHPSAAVTMGNGCSKGEEDAHRASGRGCAGKERSKPLTAASAGRACRHSNSLNQAPASEDHMTQESDNTDRPQIYGNDQEVIEDTLRLLADLDDTPLEQMTPLYYQHGFEELRMVVGDLLRILGHNPGA